MNFEVRCRGQSDEEPNRILASPTIERRRRSGCNRTQGTSSSTPCTDAFHQRQSPHEVHEPRL